MKKRIRKKLKLKEFAQLGYKFEFISEFIRFGGGCEFSKQLFKFFKKHEIKMSFGNINGLSFYVDIVPKYNKTMFIIDIIKYFDPISLKCSEIIDLNKKNEKVLMKKINIKDYIK